LLRRIFGPKTDEVTGGRRRLNNQELHNLYVSPRIIRVIKSRRMRWTVHIARMREARSAYRNMKGTHRLKELGLNGRVTLKWILKNKM